MWFIKITKATPFESVEVFRKDPFLALYFSIFSLMIFRHLCLLPSAALFTLMIWPFGPLPPQSPLRWRPHKELCFDYSAGLSTGVFLSIRANVRPPSSQWIPTKLTSSPTSSYSAPASVSIPLQLFSGSPSTAHFPFLSTTNFTKLECLHRAASRAITGCLSSSPIPLLLTEASLPPLRVTLIHFTLLSYERALRLPTSFSNSGLARLGVKPRSCRSSWRALASTHPLMLPSTCSREALLACPPCPP